MRVCTDPAVFARLQAQKRSVLDFVISDIQRMQPMVPVGQRPKLDAQLTAIAAEGIETMVAADPLVRTITTPGPADVQSIDRLC